MQFTCETPTAQAMWQEVWLRPGLPILDGSTRIGNGRVDAAAAPVGKSPDRRIPHAKYTASASAKAQAEAVGMHEGSDLAHGIVPSGRHGYTVQASEVEGLAWQDVD